MSDVKQLATMQINQSNTSLLQRQWQELVLNLTGSLTEVLIRSHFRAATLGCKLSCCSLRIDLEEEPWFMPLGAAQTGHEWLQLTWDGEEMLYTPHTLLWTAFVQNILLFQTNKNSPKYVSCRMLDTLRGTTTNKSVVTLLDLGELFVSRFYLSLTNSGPLAFGPIITLDMHN